jgi:hypothetical protein
MRPALQSLDPILLSPRIGLQKIKVMRNRPGLKLAVLLALSLIFRAEVVGASHYRTPRGMDPVLWLLGVIVAICFVGISSVVKYILAKVRIKKLREAARSLGLTYRSTANDDDCKLASGCSLMDEGHDPDVANVLEVARTDELDLTLFDFSHKRGDETSKMIVSQTVARIRAPLLKLPAFHLLPTICVEDESKPPGTDINFSDSPKFSEKYFLRGEDEAALRRLFSPTLRENLETLDYLIIDGADEVLFIFCRGNRIKPAEIAARIEQDKRIAALFFEAQRSMG